MIEPNDDVDGRATQDGVRHDGGTERLAQWPPTAERSGDPAVDAILRRLDGIPAAPIGEHGAFYEGIHDDLMTVLDSDPSAVAAAGPQITDEGGA